MAILSDLKACNMKPEDSPLAHGGITGLLLYPGTVRGKGKWLIRYVSPTTKKRRMMGLGLYPDVGIAAAGRLGMEVREKIAAGIDPLDKKVEEQEKQAKADIPTFSKSAEILHQELLPSWKNKKHGQQWINTIVKYANPYIGNLTLDKIEPKHIADVLRPIWLTKSETATRVKQRSIA